MLNDLFECINKKSIPYIINSINDTNNYENEDDYNYDDDNNNSGWILIRNKLIILLEIFNILF